MLPLKGSNKEILLKNLIKWQPLLENIINNLLRSHSEDKARGDANPSGKAEPDRFSFGVRVCGRVGFSQVEAWLKSGQACLPTEFKGRENKQKDERNSRIVMDRGRNKVISGCLFEHHTGEKKVTVGFKGGE